MQRQEGWIEVGRERVLCGDRRLSHCNSRACIHSNDGPRRPRETHTQTAISHVYPNSVNAGRREVGGVRLASAASLRRGEKHVEAKSAETAKRVQMEQFGWRKSDGVNGEILQRVRDRPRREASQRLDTLLS